MLELPDSTASLWRDSYADSIYPALEEDIEVDVAIVGGGITGLTSAYLLKEAGLRVAVIEKRTVGSGTTGRTTGKVTSQHNLIYADLYKRHGQKNTRLYGQANQAAVAEVKRIIDKERINCRWQAADNYVYTADTTLIKKFKDEAGIAAELGLPATYEKSTPLPFDVAATVKFSDQSNINSQEYLLGLAKAVHGGGSYVYENSNVTGIRDGSPGVVRTKKASVKAKSIIVATNVPTMPLVARGGYCILEYPTESYIIAARLPRDLKGMYISPDDGHYSILPLGSGDEKLVLIGGEGHLSGVRGNVEAKYQRLAEYAEARFGVTEITHKWSDRDYLSYDSIPIVGKLYPWSKHVYVGTAFMKWGLSNGTVAAMILRGTILGQVNPWAPAFDSQRLKPIASIPRVAAKYITRQN